MLSVFLIWCLEPCFQFGIQSHHVFLRFGVQSHHFSSVQCSEPPSLSSSAFRVAILILFGVQSHCFFHSLAFRAIILSWSSIRCHIFDVQSNIPDIQSHRPTWHLVSPYSFSFGVYSCRAYSFRHLESSSFILLAFRVVSLQPCHSESWLRTFIFTNIAPLTFMALCSSWFFFLTLLPCAYRLFIIDLPDFPFHYSWHSPLSSQHILQSGC